MGSKTVWRQKVSETGAKPTTLFTPEPDGGYYRLHGSADFVRTFGYPDKSGKPDRLNFGGRHITNKICNATQLTMNVEGFDPEKSRITDASGAVTLTNSEKTIAARWSFAKIMDHWKRKHSQAVYVPSMARRTSSGGTEYHYGTNIELGIGTDFEKFLSAMVQGMVYYDPGIKLENASTDKAKLKSRSQFRVNHKNLDSLYRKLEFVDIGAVKS